MRLLIATGNKGKVREFREILGESRFAWSDLSAHPELAPAEETGTTFRANACLKASYYATRLSSWALADDSGLEVDALGGAPGVYSARYAEMNDAGSGDAANNALLLRELAKVPDDRRTARFVCVLALSDPEGKIALTVRDSVDGRIIHAPRGTNGFGYDPLFVADGFEQTTAEMATDEKHRISHRGKALRQMQALMQRVNMF